MRNQSDPTQPLQIPRHEAFVQALLKGQTATLAYVKAGYRASDANAARLNGNDRIRARLAHLQQAVTTKVVDLTAITSADVLRELARLGFASMKKFSRVTEQGDAYLDLSDLSEDDWAAVQEMTSEEYLHGRGEDARLVKRTKIKLHGKDGPLVQIGKHLGMFDKNKSVAPNDVELVPQRPSPERLEEMRKRFAPKPHLHSIDGGKQT
jgi:phage terminase small subunit